METQLVQIFVIKQKQHMQKSDIECIGTGNNCEEGSDITAVVHDIHKTIDRTAWDWAYTYSNWDHLETLAR